jgi:hypothetical protein
VTTVIYLIFDVVLGTTAGAVAFAALFSLFLTCWVLLPLWSARD